VTIVTLWGTLALARVVPGLLVPILALLVALARLGLGEHYPGDVLGGMLVGAILLAISAALWRPLRGLAVRLGARRGLGVAVAIALAAAAAAAITPPGRWALLGVLAGAALALPLDSGEVRRGGTVAPEAARRDGWRAWLMVLAIGVAGLVPLAIVARLAHDVAWLAEWLVPALAALWILAAAPHLLARFGVAPVGESVEEGVPVAHGVANS